MKKYKGTIDKLEKLVVSDPIYEKDVWCRYENNFSIPNECNFELTTTRDQYNDLFFSIKIFPKENTEFNDVILVDDNSLVHYLKSLDTKRYDIGIDTAHISFGINDMDKGFSVGTTSDGMFGSVVEYSYKNKFLGITIEGYFDSIVFEKDINLINTIERQFLVNDLVEELDKDIDL